jgi:hypothetical protein
MRAQEAVVKASPTCVYQGDHAQSESHGRLPGRVHRGGGGWSFPVTLPAVNTTTTQLMSGKSHSVPAGFEPPSTLPTISYLPLHHHLPCNNRFQ